MGTHIFFKYSLAFCTNSQNRTFENKTKKEFEKKKKKRSIEIQKGKKLFCQNQNNVIQIENETN